MRAVGTYWPSVGESGFTVDVHFVRHSFSNVRVRVQYSLAHDAMDVSSAQFDAKYAVSNKVIAMGRQLRIIGQPSVVDRAVARTCIRQAWHAQREHGNYKGSLAFGFEEQEASW